MPSNISPMLATLTHKPFHEEDWLYEIKWDGFRAISYITNTSVEILSRNNKSFNEKFYPIYDQLKKWKVEAIVDGEIVTLNDEGYPDFERLQYWRSEADGELAYLIFDLLYLKGQDLTHKSLEERRALLEQIIPTDDPIIKLSETFDARGDEVFEMARQLQLEGIIAKKRNSPYKPGVRSKDWLKIKAEKSQEVIIAGYTRNENSSRKFSALIPAIYEGDTLIPLAPVGTGFSAKTQEEIYKKLKPLITKKCPFNVIPDLTKQSRFGHESLRTEIIWVKPLLVAEITYMTIGPGNALRHPSFKGLREDKNPGEVHWEISNETKSRKKSSVSTIEKSLKQGKQSHERKTLLNPKEETQTREINGHQIQFTNLSKVFWPKSGITKRDVIN